jgi:antitoxin YefM
VCGVAERNDEGSRRRARPSGSVHQVGSRRLLIRVSAKHSLAWRYIITYNCPMRTTSYSELRRNLAATLDSVVDDHAPVIITRERGKPAAVLMSLEDFASYEETRFLLQSPRNADRLLKAVAELDKGGGAEHELIE